MKNGCIMLEAPQNGEGISLSDGQGNQKILIGRLPDGSYGGKFVGSKLYGSLFRTGQENDTSYIELQPGFKPLRVVKNGKDALEITTHGDSGAIFFYDAAKDDRGGYIAAGDIYSTLGLHVIGFAKQDWAPLWLMGNPLYLESHNNDITFESRIWSNLLPTIDNSGYIGNNSYKWNTVKAQFIDPGDLCFQETTCPICEQPFTDGDIVVLLVKAIHEEHMTMAIPIHDRCKDTQKEITVSVPETETRYRLNDQGEIEEYKVSKFETVKEEIRKPQKGYQFDEITGLFTKEAVKQKKLKQDVISLRDGNKMVYIRGDKPIPEFDAFEEVEVAPERQASKEEALETVIVERKKPVHKMLTIQAGGKTISNRSGV